MSEKELQPRPIEDDLRNRIAELEAAQRWHVVKECNDVATPIDVALRKRIAELEGLVDKLIWSVEGRVEFMYSKHQREFEDIVAEYKEREE